MNGLSKSDFGEFLCFYLLAYGFTYHNHNKPLSLFDYQIRFVPWNSSYTCHQEWEAARTISSSSGEEVLDHGRLYTAYFSCHYWGGRSTVVQRFRFMPLGVSKNWAWIFFSTSSNSSSVGNEKLWKAAWIRKPSLVTSLLASINYLKNFGY